MAQTSIITGQYVCIHQTAASVLQRFGAWVIDYTLLMIALTFSASLVTPLFSVLSDTWVAVIYISITIAFLLYPLVMEAANHGQSVGKMLVGIRVVNLDGTTPSLGAYLLRWLLLLVDWAMMGVGLTFIVFTRNSQRLGDLAAGTTVVRLSKDGSSVNLYDFFFANNNYQPTFAEAANLSLKQFQVIARVLFMGKNKNRDQLVLRLAEKTRSVMGVNVPPGTNPEMFLGTVYNDYQYFMSRTV